MHPHTSSFSYRIAAAAARLGVLLTPRGLDDVLTASAVCFLALGFWLPIRHALIERHYFPSPPHFFSAVASSFSHTLATVPHRAGLPYFQTLARLPDVRAIQLPVARYLALHRHTESSPGRTISRTSPEAIRMVLEGPNSDLDCGIPPNLRYPAISGSRTHLCSDDRNYSPISISRPPPSLAPIGITVRSRFHARRHLWLTTRSITRSRRPWQ